MELLYDFKHVVIFLKSIINIGAVITIHFSMIHTNRDVFLLLCRAFYFFVRHAFITYACLYIFLSGWIVSTDNDLFIAVIF